MPCDVQEPPPEISKLCEFRGVLRFPRPRAFWLKLENTTPSSVSAAYCAGRRHIMRSSPTKSRVASASPPKKRVCRTRSVFLPATHWSRRSIAQRSEERRVGKEGSSRRGGSG